MAYTPKHKIFFGITADPNAANKIPYIPGQPAPPEPFVPAWTWDTTQTVFSSELLRFDQGYTTEQLIDMLT